MLYILHVTNLVLIRSASDMRTTMCWGTLSSFPDLCKPRGGMWWSPKDTQEVTCGLARAIEHFKG